MTFRRWLWSLAHCAGWAGGFWYAVSHVHSGAGLLIFAGLACAGFMLLVNTVDLLFGRWLRRGCPPVVLNQIWVDKMLVTQLPQHERLQDEWLPARRG